MAGVVGYIAGVSMNRSTGQWNAYCAAGETKIERRMRIEEAPEELRAALKSHLRTVWALRARARERRR